MIAEIETVTRPVTVQNTHPECLTEIFREDVNLTVWQRELSQDCREFADQFAARVGKYNRFVALENSLSIWELLPKWALELKGIESWLADVEDVIDMYRCLFEPDALGVRLQVLDTTMCPRFHIDRVPARLLVTYSGRGTEWIDERDVLRPSSPGQLPEQSVPTHSIKHIPTGAVAILKGEAWVGNEGRGIVHRSPAPGSAPRLLLSLDWLS